MKYKVISISAFVLFPIFLFGQDAINGEDYQKAIEYLQGGSILEDWFMKAFLESYREVVMSKWDSYTGIAKAIGGIAALYYFAQKSYEMMTGGRMEIMPLLKPFGLLMIILFWSGFVRSIEAPFQLIAKQASEQYHESVLGINQYRAKRSLLQMQLVDKMFEASADAEIATETGKKSWLDSAVDAVTGAVDKAIDTVVKPLVKFKMKMEVGMKMLFTQILELLALWILRICVYVVFMVQIIYTGVLVMLGPLAVAFSIFPIFRDSFANWLGRFISVQFYVIVAFIILTVTSTIQEHALLAEIERYELVISEAGVVKDPQTLVLMSMNGVVSYGMVIVSFLVSGIAILTTPTVSTWIVTSTGLGGAINTLTRGAQAAATGGKSLVMKK